MSIKNLLRILVLLAAIAIAGAIIAGFFGRAHPALDSFGHFRAHLAVALGICAILLLSLRLRWNALVAGLLACSAFATTMLGAPLLGAAQAALPDGAVGTRSYKLLQLNLRWNHPDPDRVLSFFERTDADILTLDEVSPMWTEKLATLSALYPYQLICEPLRYGSAIISKHRFVDENCYDRDALAVVTVDLDGTRVDVGSMHLNWPWPRGQSGQIGRLEQPLKTLGDTAILAGDLNATTWSAATRRVVDAGALTLVNGIGPTWLAYGIPRSMRWAGLPIDHVAVKGAIQPLTTQVLEDVGSDHWPVLVEIALKPTEGMAEAE